MGMYARFDDVIHGTPAWELADRCTACGNTGWVSYPINVSVGEEELDECPYGCQDVEPDAVFVAPLEDELVPALIASWKDERWTDPVISMARDDERASLIGQFTPLEASKTTGRVSTDEPALGVVEGPSCQPCEVPAYLIGTPVGYAPLTVDYEYLGSHVRVRFATDQAAKFRFAHEWDNSFGTRELLG